ncbi:hypothetical protein ACFLQK_01295, partial [bacterium]
ESDKADNPVEDTFGDRLYQREPQLIPPSLIDPQKRKRRPRIESIVPSTERPIKITFAAQNHILMSSNFLMEDQGSFAAWVLISEKGTGIRNGNRYIVSHETTQGGRGLKDNKYRNIFRLGYVNGDWMFGITKDDNPEKRIAFRDDLESDWHHFMIRWDKKKPIFQILINGVKVVSGMDFVSDWPEVFSKEVVIGTWPDFNIRHYVDTMIYRVFVATHYLDDGWVKKELKYRNEIKTF